MIRLVVRTDDAGMAANVGGNVDTSYKTFDVDLPEVEAFLRDKGKYMHIRLVGCELHDALAALNKETGRE